MKRAIIVGAAAFSIISGLANSGCGSKSGTVNSAPTVPTGAISRATESSFSEDAKTIAARESSDGWIPATVAAQVDSDLTRIRAFSPAVVGLHARPDDDPDSILIEIKPGASYRKQWLAGIVTTGVAAIDTLSSTYNVRSVSLVTDLGTSLFFKLSFANPMATRFIAAAYKKADATILSTSTNSKAGEGDQINRTITTGNRMYEFSKGWGDCLAGCINRHTWKFTLTSDTNISLTESGNPLP